MFDSIINIIKETAFFFNEVAIYLVFGFLMAGLLHVIFPENLIFRHIGKDNFMSVLKASIFGIPLPLCSCGVIPVAASIRKKGASKGATLSFLISTPQIGTDSFMVTYSLIGWVFAIFRIVASFITAITSGLIANVFARAEVDNNPSPESTSVTTTAWQRLKKLLPYIQIELFGSFANYLVIGFLVAGLITVLVPDSFFELYLGNQFLSMLIMLVLGIPMYICATASTPIAASLLLKGLSPGAALVFLLAGPATNAITISSIVKTMGKKAVVIYLSSIFIVSLALGYLLNFLAIGRQLPIVNLHHHEVLPAWLKIMGSIILLAMLVGHYFLHLIKGKKEMHNQDKLKVLNVNGMTCNHCAMTVKQAVKSVTNNENINVDLTNKKVFFEYDATNLEAVKKAITERGYEVVEQDA